MTYRGGTGNRRGRRRRIQASNAGNHQQEPLHQLIIHFVCDCRRRNTARVEWRARRDTTWTRPACSSRTAVTGIAPEVRRTLMAASATDLPTLRRVLQALGRSAATQLPDGYHEAGLPVTGHRIVPQPGTAYTMTGLPADLSHPGDYPAEAFCGTCLKPACKHAIDGL